MPEMGILELAEVMRRQLQIAGSVADLLLTTEVMIAETPKDEEHAQGGAPGGLGGMDMLRSLKARYGPTFNIDC